MGRGSGRRWFLICAGALLCGPLAAQGPAGRLRIAWFSEGTLDKHRAYLDAFRVRMRELGYAEGRNLTIEYYWRGDTFKNYRWLASNIVETKPDVIVATCELTASAARGATSAIPIVMTLSADPVAFGLAKSLSRPGGNLTGLSGNVIEVHGKRLELLKEIVPGIQRVALLRPKDWPMNAAEDAALERAAGRLGMRLLSIEISDTNDLDGALRALREARAQGMLDLAALSTHLEDLRPIAELPTRAGIPGVFYISELAEAGGLLSYGPNTREAFRSAARYVDRIARGAKPGELPIEQPDRFELVVNLRTARSLGVALPGAILLRADRVIE